MSDVQDFEKLRIAAEQGDHTAQYELGKMYFLKVTKDEGIAENKIEAARWLRKAAKKGVPLAQYYMGLLGTLYGYGKGDVEGDDREAVKWLHASAERGYVKAQSILGKMYLHGMNITADHFEALKWYSMAAVQGDEDALSNYRGILNMIKKAAEQGDAVALYNLGGVYRIGVGVKADLIEAAKLYRMAAAQGHVNAQISLGVMYLKGDGVTIDCAEALKWFRKAADQGDADAQYRIGAMFLNGNGIPVDHREAVKWFRMAAEKGHAEAQANLDNVNNTNHENVVDGEGAINWKSTLLLHFCRALSTGFTYVIVSLLFSTKMSLFGALVFVLGMTVPFFLIALPLSMLCIRFNIRTGPFIKYTGFVTSLGDPLLWVFNKLTMERLLPVRNLKVFSFTLVLYVVDE